MKKLFAVLILCACLMTACQSGENSSENSSGISSSETEATSSSGEDSLSDSSSQYQVTNNYSGIYEGSLVVDDFNDTTGAATVEKGVAQDVKFKITFLDDTFGTLASYNSTGTTTGSLPFTSEGNQLRMLVDYSEDETEVNKQEINLTFEERDDGIAATGTMEMAQGEDWILGTLTLTKTGEIEDSTVS